MLDLEVFCHKTDKFVVKEFGVCAEDYDCVLFSPPSKFKDLSPQQKKFFLLADKKFTVVILELTKTPYVYLTQILKHLFEKSAFNFLSQGTGKGAVFVQPS